MIKIGIFSSGLDTYWAQFHGLLNNLNGYRTRISDKIRSLAEDIAVIDGGMVDSPEKARHTAEVFLHENVDMVFLHMATYSLSSTILPIAQRLNCPLIVLNLQPAPAIDYEAINSQEDRGIMTGMWLESCQACAIPEVASVFKRSNIRFELVSGYLEDNQAWHEISGWLAAARVYKGMRENRLGILGHYYGGMLDVYTDLTRQSAIFGTHIEILEMCELKKWRDNLTEEEINHKIEEFHAVFKVSPECDAYELRRAAATSAALDKMVENHNLGALAYYYEGEEELQDIATSVIAGNTLITGRGIPVAGECEVKNAQAMKITALLGAGGSFSEIYAADFKDDIVLFGHDGPAHFRIAEGPVGLVPLPVYHGKPGKGLSIQMSVKHGPITLLSVCEGPEGISLLVAEGESVDGPTLQIGNTNSRYRFACGAKAFLDAWAKAGPSHHCSIGIGHFADTLEKVAALFDIGITIIK